MLEGLEDTGGCTVLSATTSAKPSPLKSALTTPLENSVGGNISTAVAAMVIVVGSWREHRAKHGDEQAKGNSTNKCV